MQQIGGSDTELKKKKEKKRKRKTGGSDMELLTKVDDMACFLLNI